MWGGVLWNNVQRMTCVSVGWGLLYGKCTEDDLRKCWGGYYMGNVQRMTCVSAREAHLKFCIFYARNLCLVKCSVLHRGLYGPYKP